MAWTLKRESGRDMAATAAAAAAVGSSVWGGTAQAVSCELGADGVGVLQAVSRAGSLRAPQRRSRPITEETGRAVASHKSSARHASPAASNHARPQRWPL